MSAETPRYQAVSAAWSNRVVLLALLGIAYLTLFPFEFHAGAFLANYGNPFLLGHSGKQASTKDFLLNVLLFVPLGFGISAQVCKRNGGLAKAFVWALLLGAFFSYSVEFTQLYIPERDSGWEDVFSNALGSVVGCLSFALVGGPLLEWASRAEKWIQERLSARGAAAALVGYFLAGFGISAYLQRETRLSNWDPRCILFVGNDASGHAPWSGQVFSLQIWSRALPAGTLGRLATGQPAENVNPGLLGSYEFHGGSPFLDQRNSLPALGWVVAEQSQLADGGAAQLGPKSWLSTKVPVESLNREIQKASQFTVRVVCKPAAVDSGFGRIVSLSRSSENVNFHLRQAGSHLVLYFRNPLSETRSVLAWDLPGVFKSEETLDIVAAYDGSDAFVYVNGKSVTRSYRLGPGAALFHDLQFVRTPELQGCVVVYLTILFLPAGVLLGLAARDWVKEKRVSSRLLILGVALPAVLLDLLLSLQSGRGVLPGNMVLSVAFELAGILLINSDGMKRRLATDLDAKRG